MSKVEIMVQVLIGGRPIWRMIKAVRPELSQKMTDAEYDPVVAAAAKELYDQVKKVRAKEREEKATAK